MRVVIILAIWTKVKSLYFALVKKTTSNSHFTYVGIASLGAHQEMRANCSPNHNTHLKNRTWPGRFCG